MSEPSVVIPYCFRQNTRMNSPSTTALAALLQPRSIAVVGASNDVHRIRGRLLAMLLAREFPGAIYPVNPSAKEVQGLRAYASVGAIGAAPDLAMIAVPAEHTMGVLEDCARAGVKAAIVHASGAAEDHSLVGAIAEFAARTGVRVLGPNAEGLLSVLERVGANFAPAADPKVFAPESLHERPDRVSIVSQSGSLGFSLYGAGVLAGLGFRHVITTGNEADLETLELADHLVSLGTSRAILMFLEGLTRPERFAGLASRAADAGVPLIVAKVGRSEAGQRAAVSHTAHLAGADAAYDAVFRRYGVVRVADVDEMIATAAVLSQGRRLRGRRLAVVTTTGGAGGWVSDLASAAGLEVPPLEADLRERLGRVVPSYGSTANPIDITAKAIEDNGASLVTVLDDAMASDAIDGAIVMMNMTGAARVPAITPALKPLLARLTKPVVFHSPSPPAQSNILGLAHIGAPYCTMRGAVLGLAASLAYERFRERWAARSEAAAPRGRNADGLFDAAGAASPRALQAMLESHGVRFAPQALVQTAAEAASAAAAMGFPVALKVQSADIPHKTEAGALALDLADASAVSAAFDRITTSARRHVPHARIDAVQVQKMMPPGREMAVGVVTDPDFGPLVMLGFGGIYVEVLADVAFAPVPLSRADAIEMIGSLRGAAILKGARGQPGADLDALADLLVGVADAVRACGPALAELDLNPVLVYPQGRGCVAVDALAVAKKTGKVTA